MWFVLTLVMLFFHFPVCSPFTVTKHVINGTARVSDSISPQKKIHPKILTTTEKRRFHVFSREVKSALEVQAVAFHDVQQHTTIPVFSSFSPWWRGALSGPQHTESDAIWQWYNFDLTPQPRNQISLKCQHEIVSRHVCACWCACMCELVRACCASGCVCMLCKLVCQ